jgi:hypothetical protein
VCALINGIIIIIIIIVINIITMSYHIDQDTVCTIRGCNPGKSKKFLFSSKPPDRYGAFPLGNGVPFLG